jgi:hypothetical protein
VVSTIAQVGFWKKKGSDFEGTGLPNSRAWATLFWIRSFGRGFRRVSEGGVECCSELVICRLCVVPQRSISDRPV